MTLPVKIHTARSVYELCQFLDGWKLRRITDNHPHGHIDRFTREGLGKWHKLLEPPKTWVGARLTVRLPDGKLLFAGEVTCIEGHMPVECIPEFEDVALTRAIID